MAGTNQITQSTSQDTTNPGQRKMQHKSVAAVFQTYELIENILLFLPAGDIFVAATATQSMSEVVERSKAVYKKLECAARNGGDGRYGGLNGPLNGSLIRACFMGFSPKGDSSSMDHLLVRYKNGIVAAVLLNHDTTGNWTVKIFTSTNSKVCVKKRRHGYSYRLALVIDDLRYQSSGVQYEPNGDLTDFYKLHMSTEEMKWENKRTQYKYRQEDARKAEGLVKYSMRLEHCEAARGANSPDTKLQMEQYRRKAGELREGLIDMDHEYDKDTSWTRELEWTGFK